jgi:hypothetical protein
VSVMQLMQRVHNIAADIAVVMFDAGDAALRRL